MQGGGDECTYEMLTYGVVCWYEWSPVFLTTFDLLFSCPSVFVLMCLLCCRVVHVYNCGSSDIRDCSECVTLPGELDCGYCRESGLT